MSLTSFDKIPLSAVGNATRCVVSNLLNTHKVLPSPSGYPRDFRGLCYFTNTTLPPCKSPDPTAIVLKNWEKSSNPTVADFILALQELDRWDIVDDIQHLLEEDVREFQRKGFAAGSQDVSLDSGTDRNILTIDDVQRLEEGLQPQNYDAFLLYSDDDAEFAKEMVDRLERTYKLKLCLKDRDLVGGVTFEHEAIMRLISERCKRLIIIVSPSFIQSPANKFFVTYAQALGIEQRQRKIVPCIYKRVPLPPELSYYFVLDYTRSSPFWNFWDKLSHSVKSPVAILEGAVTSRSSVPPVTIKEISCETTPLKPSEWVCPSKSPQLAIQGAKKPETEVSSTEQNGASASKDKPKKKSKLSSFLLSRLLPSPPSEKPSKQLFKTKKKAVALNSS